MAITPGVAALPALALSIGAYATRWLIARWSPTTLILRSLLLNTAALTARLVDDGVVLVLSTAACATSIAALTVVIPPVVRAAPPGQAGPLTSAYGIAIGLGATAGAAATPLVAETHSWQLAAAMWAALPTITAATLTYAALTGKSPLGNKSSLPAKQPATPPHRPGTPWLLGAYFGTVCATTMSLMIWIPSILRDTGHTASEIAQLSAIALLFGIPTSAAIPRLAARARAQTCVTAPITASTTAGISGLLLAPAQHTALWMILIGLGFGAFIHALTLISLRSPDAATATHWSPMAQGTGYLIAAMVVFACGLLGRIDGDSRLALVLLLVLCLVQTALTLVPATNKGSLDAQDWRPPESRPR